MDATPGVAPSLPRRPRGPRLLVLFGLAVLCYVAAYGLLRATGALRPVWTVWWVDLSGAAPDDAVVVRASDAIGGLGAAAEAVFWPLREAEAAYRRTRPPPFPW